MSGSASTATADPPPIVVSCAALIDVRTVTPVTDHKIKRPGRPALPPGEAKTARVELRVRPITKAAWMAKAAAVGLTLQEWIERALDRAK